MWLSLRFQQTSGRGRSPRSYGWKDMPDNYNLSFLVSLNPPRSGRRQWAPEGLWRGYSSVCPKGPTAEPQLPKPVGVLLSLLFVPKIRPIKTEHRSDI